MFIWRLKGILLPKCIYHKAELRKQTGEKSRGTNKTMGNIKEVLVIKKSKTDKNIWTKREEERWEARRKEETTGELCFVCHLLLMRHMWAALETMSHAHNGTVATIGSEQAPSVKDDCVGICYSTADFYPVMQWLSTIYRFGLPFGRYHWCTSDAPNHSEVCHLWEAHVYRCAGSHCQVFTWVFPVKFLSFSPERPHIFSLN